MTVISLADHRKKTTADELERNAKQQIAEGPLPAEWQQTPTADRGRVICKGARQVEALFRAAGVDLEPRQAKRIASEGLGVPKTFAVRAFAVSETHLALKTMTEFGELDWTPKSQIDETSEVKCPGDGGTLVVAHWFAASRGWVEIQERAEKLGCSIVRASAYVTAERVLQPYGLKDLGSVIDALADAVEARTAESIATQAKKLKKIRERVAAEERREAERQRARNRKAARKAAKAAEQSATCT